MMEVIFLLSSVSWGQWIVWLKGPMLFQNICSIDASREHDCWKKISRKLESERKKYALRTIAAYLNS